MPIPCGAPGAGDGGPRRNLHIAFENLSASAAPDLEAGRPAFKRSNLAQTVIDVIAVASGCLLVASVSVSIGAAFVLLFCGDCR